ncbi:hypothetical protein ACFQZ4_44055 [Catellatospora coxensis]
MRSVFVFPAGERAETVATLDRHLLRGGDDWVLEGKLWIGFVTGRDFGGIFWDRGPDDVALVEAAVGSLPGWGLQIDVSGRIDGAAEVGYAVAMLLERGGVAVDDYSAHPWTLPEIESGTVVDGLRFFDHRAWCGIHCTHPPVPGEKGDPT